MSDVYSGMAKVVAIIDDYKFVINKGDRDGVAIGDNYLVFGLGEAISDPESNEDLGRLELVRGRASVVHVQEKLSTLESKEFERSAGRKKIIRKEGAGAGLAGLFGQIPTVEEIEEGGDTYQKNLGVIIGDLARPV